MDNISKTKNEKYEFNSSPISSVYSFITKIIISNQSYHWNVFGFLFQNKIIFFCFRTTLSNFKKIQLGNIVILDYKNDVLSNTVWNTAI